MFAFLASSGCTLRLIIGACIRRYFPDTLWSTISDVLLTNIVGSSIAGYVKGAALARSIEEHISSSSASVSDVISTSSPRSSENSDSSTFRRSYRFIPSSLILDYSYLLGLCGCCTTYGSMMSYALTLFINPSYYNVSQNTPSTFESFSDAVFSLVASIVLSAGSFRFFLFAGRVAPIQLRLKYLFLVGGLSPLLIGAILVAVNGPVTLLGKSQIFSVLLSPLGAFLRAYLSQNLNSPTRFVKYTGTLSSNILGTFISAAVQGYYFYNDESLGFNALSVGFAGSLSTVSTFVGEIEGEEEEGNSIGYTTITVVLTVVTSLLGFLAGGWRA
ncbi:hypothetical protein TrST_g4606 [Triparma strigata]|uniref:Uncharacterized protein n=1 Tax=Triparma strigata TaxID=1606541 RepID=A0A9W6ZFP9_9STRA|nr:hypothetical protein TrST_g4606 [Triparma strigata]